VKNSRNDHIVGRQERGDIVILECRVTGSPRAWLEHCDQAAVLVLQPQSCKGFAHCRRMMRKIVNHSHAVYFTTDLASAAHALEGSESRGDRCARYAPGVGGDDYCQAIAHVKVADQV